MKTLNENLKNANNEIIASAEANSRLRTEIQQARTKPRVSIGSHGKMCDGTLPLPFRNKLATLRCIPKSVRIHSLSSVAVWLTLMRMLIVVPCPEQLQQLTAQVTSSLNRAEREKVELEKRTEHVIHRLSYNA
jgi:hypothetical protein